MNTDSATIAPPHSGRGKVWRNVAFVLVLFCALYALPNFILLPRLLPPTTDILAVALWMAAGFTLSGAIILPILLWWLRRDGLTLADVGWGKPVNAPGIILGLLVGAAWLAFSFWGLAFRLPQVDLTHVTLARVLAGLGTAFAGGVVEELALRGLVMEGLRRGHAATWVQVVVSGAVFAIYHSLHDLSGFPYSLFIGCLWGLVYVVSKRSLTASIVSHGMVNLLGEPFLLMMVVASF